MNNDQIAPHGRVKDALSIGKEELTPTLWDLNYNFYDVRIKYSTGMEKTIENKI